MSEVGADVAFGLCLGLFLVFETWAIFNKEKGDTLSERLRVHFRTGTKRGAFIFLFIWGAFAAWMAAHIVTLPV